MMAATAIKPIARNIHSPVAIQQKNGTAAPTMFETMIEVGELNSEATRRR